MTPITTTLPALANGATLARPARDDKPAANGMPRDRAMQVLAADDRDVNDIEADDAATPRL
jgi:hypothetical protein